MSMSELYIKEISQSVKPICSRCFHKAKVSLILGQEGKSSLQIFQRHERRCSDDEFYDTDELYVEWLLDHDDEDFSFEIGNLQKTTVFADRIDQNYESRGGNVFALVLFHKPKKPYILLFVSSWILMHIFYRYELENEYVIRIDLYDGKCFLTPWKERHGKQEWKSFSIQSFLSRNLSCSKKYKRVDISNGSNKYTVEQIIYWPFSSIPFHLI